MFIIKNTITRPELNKFIDDLFSKDEVNIVSNVQDEKSEGLILSGQLQNIYLFPKLHETTIGEFLNQNPEIIKKAFDTDHFEYEPYLEWKEHDGTCTDTAINPDLMIKRSDGNYDIYDLKTGLLDVKKITTGKRNRRRFKTCVEDGIAQLANYREYFEYEKNIIYAKEKYSITVNKPKLILVVGNYDNSHTDEIKQASRKSSDITIIDYDSFCQLFVASFN